MLIESFVLELFTNIVNNGSYDIVKFLSKKALNSLKSMPPKENPDEFKKIILEIMNEYKEDIHKLYEKSNGDVNNFFEGNQYNINNIVMNGKDNYIDHYNEGVENIKKGDYSKAIENLKIFSHKHSDDLFHNYPNITDADLLIIAAYLCNDYVDNLIKKEILKNNDIDKYIEIINDKYSNNYLGLVILGIFYSEYIQNEQKVYQIEKRIKHVDKDEKYSYIAKILNCEDKTRKRLGLQELFECAFELSKESTKIENYRCFYNVANDNYIDGLELKNLDEESRKRWYFFYKPNKQYIGVYQKQKIKELNSKIKKKKEKIEELLLYSLKQSLSAILIILVFIKINYLLISLIISLLAIFSILKVFKKIDKLEELINKYILYNKELKYEIDFLYKQLPTDNLTIEEMEYQLTLDLEQVKDLIPKIVKNSENFISKNLYLFKEWAFLQPSSKKEKFGFEKTGIKSITDDIKYKISTFSEGGKNINPLYRVWYIQFIYISDKNVITYGLFYDLITKKEYGNKSESFQYTHISNLSISEIKLKENDIYGRMNISNDLIAKIYGKNFHLISFGVSSGKSLHFIIEEDNADKTIVRPLESAYTVLTKIKEKVNHVQRDFQNLAKENNLYFNFKQNIPDYH